MSNHGGGAGSESGDSGLRNLLTYCCALCRALNIIENLTVQEISREIYGFRKDFREDKLYLVRIPGGQYKNGLSLGAKANIIKPRGSDGPAFVHYIDLR